MAFAIARVGDMTATGDPIIGPGIPTVIIGGAPVAVLGDAVSGPNCIGTIVAGSATVLIGGRPAAHVQSQVTGVNPATGAPVSTTIMTGFNGLTIS